MTGVTDGRDVLAERDMLRAYRTGALLGLVLFAVVLTGMRATLLSWAPTADFYDAQADAFLDGRLDIDPERLGIEGFESGGRTYMYQPPWPAILRLPVAASTDSYEGRLAQVSLLVAMVVTVAAAGRFLVGARRAVRAGAAATGLERAAAFGFGLVVAGGSVPVFLASRAWVYHESALWGLAWTSVALAALVRLHRTRTWGSLAMVTAATFGAVGSRASVGAAACAGLGLLAVASLVRHRDRPLRQRLGGPAGAVALLLAAALPAAAYVSLNVAKFGTVASIPFENQGFTRLSPARQAMLEANDGSLFGLQFAPTTLVHYLRPDGLRLGASFPFVDFPAPGGPVVGDVTFDLVDRTASMPASLPVLVVAAGAGVWALARRRVDDPWLWAVVAAAGAVGTLTIVPFGYVAHRYLADVMPLLIPLAALGLHAAVAAADGRPRSGSPRRLALWAVIVVLVPVTVWINVGLATVYQRLYVPTPDPDLTAGLVDARTTVGRPPEVLRAEALPDHASTGDLVAIGDCEALYIWDGTPVGEFRRHAWVPVERTEAAGHVIVEVDLPGLAPGRHRLVEAPQAGPVLVWVERRPDGAVLAGIDGAGGSTVGRPVQPAGRRGFDVVLDPHAGEATIRLGDEILVSTGLTPGTDVDGLIVGGGSITDSRAPGTRGDDGSLCREATS